MNNLSDLIVECPLNNSCLGNDGTFENFDYSGKCASNYEGNACSQCVDGYGVFDGKCVDCSSYVWYYIKLIFLFVFRFGLLALNVLVEIIKPSFPCSERVFEKNTMIKMFTNLFFTYGLVLDLKYPWPQDLKDHYLATQAFTYTQDQYINLDCMLKESLYGQKS